MSGSVNGGFFAPAPVVQPQQALGGSPLAQAMMRPMSPPQLQTPGAGMMGPLLQMLMQSKQGGQPPSGGAAPPGLGGGPPGLFDRTANGIGNLIQGAQWNGMPGQQQMGTLNNQAAGNVAGMVPGMGTTGNGPI